MCKIEKFGTVYKLYKNSTGATYTEIVCDGVLYISQSSHVYYRCRKLVGRNIKAYFTPSNDGALQLVNVKKA